MAPPRFFDQPGRPSTIETIETSDPGHPTRLAFNHPRPIVGAAERLSTGPASKNTSTRIDKRPTQAWQTQAWQSFEAIGEVHYALSLLGAVMSRVSLYVGVVTATDQPPAHIDDYLTQLAAHHDDPTPQSSRTVDTLTTARHLLEHLTANTPGGEGGMLRQMGINLSVPGEFYLVQETPGSEGVGTPLARTPTNGATPPPPNSTPSRWHVASTDELVRRQNGSYALRLTRTDSPTSPTSGPGPSLSGSQGRKRPGDVDLAPDAFVARIWRSHPRFSREPDSSMLGVLDSCEQLIILQQALRSITRSRMAAGVIYIPEGIAVFATDPTNPQPDQVEEAITRAAMTAVEDEASAETLVPLVLKGPPELGSQIQWIPLGRQVDDNLVSLVDRTLERVLQGLDIPKEIVSGLANVRYSNAIVIDDSLYRTHIEPLVLLVTDALTSVYLRPLLARATATLPEELQDPDHIINRTVVWADTSSVVTRPDRSQAANEGFDKRILSADAWRQARGFADSDAPSPDELLQRLVLDRGQLPPDLVQSLLELVAPEFFKTVTQQGAEQLPSDISDLLNPDSATQPTQPTTPEGSPSVPGVPPPSVQNRDRTQTTNTRPPSNVNGGDLTSSPGASPAPIPQR